MEQRANHRFPTEVVVHCRIPATPIQAKILNLSVEGCLAEATARGTVRKGNTLVVNITPTVSLTGQIVWTHDAQFGVKFDTPLEADDLAQVCIGLELPARDQLRDSFGRVLPNLPALLRSAS